MTENIWKQRTQ